MIVARTFLGLMGAVWLGFGLKCFVDPDFLRLTAGVTYLSATGSVDLRATYGGLQIGIGVLVLAGALRSAATRNVLVMFGVICAGVGCSRLVAALLSSEWSNYTLYAVCFELAAVAVTLVLLTRMRAA